MSPPTVVYHNIEICTNTLQTLLW